MDALNRDIQSGTLGQLNLLHSQSERLLSVQNGVLSSTVNDEELRLLLDKLLNKKKSLQQELTRKKRLTSLGDLLSQHESIDGKDKLPVRRIGEDSSYRSAHKDGIPKAKLQMVVDADKQTKLSEILIAYRLSGKTIIPINVHHVCIRFETFFDGRYFESFYVVLHLGQGEENARVAKHTVPYFVPMEEIEKIHLSRDVKKFMSVVGEYLNSYIARREKLVRFENREKQQRNDLNQRSFRLRSEIYASAAFDFSEIFCAVPKLASLISRFAPYLANVFSKIAELSFESHDCPTLKIQLIHENLLEQSPSKVMMLAFHRGKEIVNISREFPGLVDIFIATVISNSLDSAIEAVIQEF